MRPRTLRHGFGPFKGMHSVAEESAERPDLLRYALNMTCADPERGAAYTVRPPAVSTTGTVGATSLIHMFERSGQTIMLAIDAGQRILALTAPTTWVQVVSNGQLTSAGITIDASATLYAITFNDQVFVSDGVNKPWLWDGTTGGGLTLLSNCPVLYGQPTEYAGKVFGIKASDHRTIVWSEENDATTGYESGGFNNAWEIAQQADTPLVRLMGRNDGLYYWRTRSMGVIRGQVATDFSTTATHDAISSTIGLAGPGAAVDSGSTLWWYGTNERIYAYPIGADEPTDVSPETTAQHSDDLIPQYVPRWYRSGDVSFAAAYATQSWACVMGPNDVNDRKQVWFALPGYIVTSTGSVTQAPNGIVVAYDVGTQRAISWVARQADSVANSSFSRMTAVVSPDGLHGRFVATYDLRVNAVVFWHWQTLNQAGSEGSTSVTGYVVGPTAGTDTQAEQGWLQLDAICRIPPSFGGGAGTLALSLYDVLTTTATAMTAAVGTLTANTLSPSNRRVTFGIDMPARSLVPAFAITWTAGASFGQWQGFGLERYTMTASAVSEDVNVY